MQDEFKWYEYSIVLMLSWYLLVYNAENGKEATMLLFSKHYRCDSDWIHARFQSKLDNTPKLGMGCENFYCHIEFWVGFEWMFR